MKKTYSWAIIALVTTLFVTSSFQAKGTGPVFSDCIDNGIRDINGPPRWSHSIDDLASPLQNYLIEHNLPEPHRLKPVIVADQAAYHLFSHGRPGELLISNQWRSAPELARILSDGRLAGKKQLNIYGCNFARGKAGRDAVALLSQTLGLPVAASDDLTGPDGDWQLEVTTPGLSTSDYQLPATNYPHNLQTICGVDIHIANDNSSSVNSEENRQSRAFVSQLGFAFEPYGTTNDRSRVSISSWGSSSDQVEHDFPLAGPNFTTSLSDILSYQSTPRVVFRGTDPYRALLQARTWVNQNPIAGRIAPKVIILMTDANCGQVNNNISGLATQIKNQGIFIVVMAIDNAGNCPKLQGTNVASPGGFFAAGDYQTLADDAINFVDNIRTTVCANLTPPQFDLTVNLSNFEITNCNPGPAAAAANYTVTNNSFGESFNGNLQISFYNGDPTLPGTQYLFTENAGTQTIALNGGTFSGTVNDPSLLNTATLYAVVNFDGGQAGNGVPLFYSQLPNQITVPDEGDVSNNISSATTRTDGTGCLPFANLDVQVTNSGVGCDDEVIYTVEICNTGTGDAAGFGLQTYPPAGAAELDSTIINGLSNFIFFQQRGGDIDGEAGGDDSGRAISLSSDGNTVAIGAPRNDNPATFQIQMGHVRIYDWNGTAWTQRGADIDGENSSDRSGDAVSLSSDGNTVAIGASLNDDVDFRTGHVRIYDWNGAAWTQRGADIDGEVFLDDNGEAVSLSSDGNTVAISATGFDGNGTNSGYVRIFDWNGAAWTQRGADIDGEAASDNSGDEVSLSSDGNTVAISARRNDGNGTDSGHVRIFDWNGAAWTQRGGDLDGEAAGDLSGNSVSLSSDGNTVAIGALNNGGNGTFSGHVRIFDWNGAAWTQRGADIDGEAVAEFSGESVSLSSGGNTVAIGASGNDGNGTNSGRVRIYDWNGTAWTQRGGGIDGEAADDSSGGSVSLSSDGNIVAIGAVGNDGNGSNSGHVRVYVGTGVTLPAGTCVTYQYTYDISGLAAGTYDYSVDVAAMPATGDDPVQYSPNTNFTVGGNTGLNGFDGAQNGTDDLVYSGSSPACPVGDQVTVSVIMTGDGDCPGAFGTTTVTINNQSGQTLSNALLTLDLSGTGATYSGEPYNKTNGLALAEPNIFDPAYPNVPNALSEKSGPQTLAIFTLPAGTSTFDLDYLLGTTMMDLNVEVTQLPATVNVTGAAAGAASITPGSVPQITGTCPAAVTAAATTLTLNYTATNAASVAWNSGSGGSFANPNAGSTTYTINDIDRANGFVDLALTALSADGCDETAFCRVLINGIDYDYGDAPASYDLNESLQPVAAAATVSPDLFLGAILPDVEAMTQPSADATGDGADEDGLMSTMLPAAIPGQSNYAVEIQVTNNSGADAYVYGFMDWNNDGNWNADPDERSALLTVPTGGLSTQTLLFNVPAGYTGGMRFLRLRISSDEVAVGSFFGPAANGEVEDYEATALACLDPPTADAGAATANICSNEDYAAMATATNGSIAWTTNGDGTFADPAVEDAVYTPGSGDISSGSVTLTMTVTGTSPGCAGEIATDDVTLTIGAAPTADAGAAAGAVCADDAYTAAATATGGTILWTTSGDGTFTNTTVEDAVYTPGAGDISSGSVTLTMTVTGTSPGCAGEIATDDVTLTIGAAPTADAGAAAGAVCAGDAYTAAATATGGTILWTTSGDGTFTNTTVEDAVYTPGAGDISSGSVTLTMTVTGTSPGCGGTTASDMVLLTINPLPATPAITGDTDPLCLNETRILTTTASGTIVWSSSDVSVATVDPNTGEVTPVAVGSVDITYTVTDANGCSATSGAFPLTITDVGCVGELEIKVMLQGALLGSPDALMRDDLRSGGYIPLSEPYSGSGNPRFAAHGSGGGETTTSGVLAANAGTPDAIVDWVLVELRDAATPATIVETRAALLQRDGDVVDPTDGVSPLVIDGTAGSSYYVSVKHRNHLGVMTATPRAFIVGATTTVDFITATAAEVFDVSGGVGYDGFERILISGQQALWAGNANADDQVKYQGPGNDAGNILFEVLFSPTNTGFVYNFNNAFGYFDGDINMDGQVKYQGPANDPSFVFFNLIFNYSGLNTSNLYNYDFLTEQLP